MYISIHRGIYFNISARLFPVARNTRERKFAKIHGVTVNIHQLTMPGIRSLSEDHPSDVRFDITPQTVDTMDTSPGGAAYHTHTEATEGVSVMDLAQALPSTSTDQLSNASSQPTAAECSNEAPVSGGLSLLEISHSEPKPTDVTAPPQGHEPGNHRDDTSHGYGESMYPPSLLECSSTPIVLSGSQAGSGERPGTDSHPDRHTREVGGAGGMEGDLTNRGRGDRTDNTNPKISSPKTSSPKTNSPKTISPKTSSPKINPETSLNQEAGCTIHVSRACYCLTLLFMDIYVN